ncbi:FAD-binding oxidoreductase [Octadecabacter sp. G9-8]|uniref:FAD-binding oxidoreductase n=1 Tax=Octadecabacter dasysiphoniae TaxID=2909341 RepID=A0ABS9CZX8_9RHOB|nr:FAD-binding oxidoreductase [Octadecabacter dasysiphoniae]MCF2872830.1 FAD-binding oxidoreductase [Octadecabacter dasysiphoniae]
MKVIVVGSGVIGAAIAFQLSKAGADVTVVDAGTPAASDTSFGWINASFYADTAHHHLRVASIAAYDRLTNAVAGLPISKCGALWWEAQGTELQQMQRSLEMLAYPVEHLTRAQVKDFDPDIKGLPDDVLHFTSESCADVAGLAHVLLQASGARFVRGVAVRCVTTHGGVVTGVETTMGPITADRVVIAAGNGAPDILSSVGVALPMLIRPGALVTTKPSRARITSIMVTPHGEVRQLSDGRFLASAVANHQADDASTVTEAAGDIGERVMGWLNPIIAGDDLEWDQVALAYRPVPKDGLPVIGAVGPDGLHVAVMHSGATLAAITGEAIAAQIMGQGDLADLIAPYSPQRFQ